MLYQEMGLDREMELSTSGKALARHALVSELHNLHFFKPFVSVQKISFKARAFS